MSTSIIWNLLSHCLAWKRLSRPSHHVYSRVENSYDCCENTKLRYAYFKSSLLAQINWRCTIHFQWKIKPLATSTSLLMHSRNWFLRIVRGESWPLRPNQTFEELLKILATAPYWNKTLGRAIEFWNYCLLLFKYFPQSFYNKSNARVGVSLFCVNN